MSQILFSSCRQVLFKVACLGGVGGLMAFSAKNSTQAELLQRLEKFRKEIGISIEPLSKDPFRDKSVTSIILSHHANTAWTKEKRLQGQIDIPLSEEGFREARRLAEEMLKFTEGKPPVAILSSSSIRAVQTAEVIAGVIFKKTGKRLSIEKSEALRGENHDQSEGLTEEELKQQEHYQMFKKMTPLQKFFTPFGAGPQAESKQEVLARAVPKMHDIARRFPGEVVFLVTHGGDIKGLLFATEEHPENLEATPGAPHGDFVPFQDNGAKVSRFPQDQMPHNRPLEPFYNEAKKS